MKTLHKILFISIFMFLYQIYTFGQITDESANVYTTFQEVADFLSANTITQDKIFSIDPGTYNEQFSLPENNSTFSITFNKSGSGEVLIYNAASISNNYVIEIKGSNYTFENLSFKNTSNVSLVGRVITIGVSSANTENITFNNCNLYGRTDGSISADDSYSVVYASTDGSLSINNIRFQNDSIEGGSSSINFSTPVQSSFSQVYIKESVIKDFFQMGIYFQNINDLEISKNIFTDINTSESIIVSGIDFDGSYDFIISSNKINIQRTVFNESVGINIESKPNSSQGVLSNNMITNNSSSVSNVAYGMNFFNNPGIIDVFFNSIHIQDAYNASKSIRVWNSKVNLKNNLFVRTGSADAYAMAIENLNNIISSDYNCFFSERNDKSYILNYDGSIDYSLYNWQTTTLMDYNSFSAMPEFVSSTDLHLNTNKRQFSESRGSAETGIQVDIDGDERSTNGFIDVGADEGDFQALWSGNILNTITWSGEVHIGSEIIIDTTATLVLVDGTQLYFSQYSNINVLGAVYATGSEFTAENKSLGWKGITHFDVDGINNTSTYNNCQFKYVNNLGVAGGALYIEDNNTITIEKCKFIENKAFRGGAIYLDNCLTKTPSFNGNLFSKNYAEESGGAIFNDTGLNLNIVNSVFYENSVDSEGGAIYISNTTTGPVTFYNNTFYNNSAGSDGQDIFFDNAQSKILNSIFWNDGNDSLLSNSSANQIEIQNCIIKGGESGISGSHTSSSIFDEDPNFTNPQNLNFSVQANSPAVNAGNSSYAPGFYDYAGNDRIYDNGTVDIGAYELQAEKLVADAEDDISDCFYDGYSKPLFLYPYPYTGSLTVIEGYANIREESGGMYLISDVPAGTTAKLLWAVTNGVVTATDTISVTNTQPTVNAGEDIIFINPDPNNDIYPDTAFNASLPPMLYSGTWTQITSSATPNPTIGDQGAPNSPITGVHYGISAFKWEIDDSQSSCSNSDTVLLIAGHSFTSDPADGTLDWDNPNDWDVQGVPGDADSVTIFNCIANINIADAKCDRLYIGSGANVNLEGTTKGSAGFTCRSVFIEQNAEKFKNIKGVANFKVSSDATLNIGADFLNKGRSSRGSGLFIGSGGTVFIEQNAEKLSRGLARLNIGSGGMIFIEQNAEKGSRGVAELRIGTGGMVFIEQNAEKDKSNEKGFRGGDLYIGSGGYVFIEQNAEKAAGGFLHLAGGRTIFIEQNAEKGAFGGHLGLYGGAVFIEQNAEKASKGFARSGLYLGRGGTIFIEQNAEKALSVPELIVPEMYINGGKVRVGNNVKSKAVTGRLQFRQIFIEQNAEKDFASDTALIVYPNGGLNLSDSTFMPPMMMQDPYFIDLAEGTAVSFLEGSEVNLGNSNQWEKAIVSLEEGASFIDMNPNSRFGGKIEHIFKGDVHEGFSSSLESVTAGFFGTNVNVGSWSEIGGDWNIIPDLDPLLPGTGYYMQANANDAFVELRDTLNTGDVDVPVTAGFIGGLDETGWNLLGNPFASGIDLEQIDMPFGVNKNFYTYNPDVQNYAVYQQGGVSINNASQYIGSNKVFFVKADAPGMFSFDNSARVHYNQANVKNTNTTQNTLKLKVEKDGLSDEIAVIFNENATDAFDSEYDAVKKLNMSSEAPVLYSLILSEDAPIAINTLSFQLIQRIVDLEFKGKESGIYTINVSELTFGSSVTVYLKDLDDNSMHDLRANPTYSFNYTVGDDLDRFQLIFDGFSGIEDVNTENNINVFSDKNTIFINSEYENAKVEVLNINGQLLLQENISAKGISSINTNFSAGIYLVKVSTNEETITKKVVLSK